MTIRTHGIRRLVAALAVGVAGVVTAQSGLIGAAPTASAYTGPELKAQMAATPAASIPAGQKVTYTVSVTNAGPDTAFFPCSAGTCTKLMESSVPEGFAIDSYQVSLPQGGIVGYGQTGQTINVYKGSLRPGHTVTLTVTVRAVGAPGTRTFVTTADPNAALAESDEKDNTHTFTVTIT